MNGYENPYKKWLNWLNLENTREKAGLLMHFKNLFLAENKKINLASLKTAKDFDIVHIRDCLSIIPYILFAKNNNQSNNQSKEKNQKYKAQILDLGSGGGLPGIPLAISLPNYHFTMMDSVRKKVNFVQECICKLKLENAKAFHERIENWRNSEIFHNKFDLIVSRAFGEMDFIIELSYPLLKNKGYYLFYRGKNGEHSIRVLGGYLKEFGGEINGIFSPFLTEKHKSRYIFKVFPGRNRTFSRKTYHSIKKASLFRHKKAE